MSIYINSRAAKPQTLTVVTKSEFAKFVNPTGNVGTSNSPNSLMEYNVQGAFGDTISGAQGPNDFLAVSIKEAHFPFSFYSIDARNNELLWSWTGATDVRMALNHGNYTPNELLEEINYQLANSEAFADVNKYRFVTRNPVLDIQGNILGGFDDNKAWPSIWDGFTYDYAPSNATSYNPQTLKYEATFFRHASQADKGEFTIKAKGFTDDESFPFDQLGLPNLLPQTPATATFSGVVGGFGTAPVSNPGTYTFKSTNTVNEYSDELASMHVRVDFIAEGGRYGGVLQKIPVERVVNNQIHYTSSGGGVVHLIRNVDLQRIKFHITDGTGRYMDFQGRNWGMTLQFDPVTLDPVALPTKTDLRYAQHANHKRRRVDGARNASIGLAGMGAGGGAGMGDSTDMTNDVDLNQVTLDGPTRSRLNPYMS